MKRNRIKVQRYFLVYRQRSLADHMENRNRQDVFSTKRVPKYRIVAGKKVLAEYFDSREEAEKSLATNWTVEGIEKQMLQVKLAHLERVEASSRQCANELHDLKNRKIKIEVI